MKFIIPGFIAGIILNFFLFPSKAGTEVVSQWVRPLEEICTDTVKQSSRERRGDEFLVTRAKNICLVDEKGDTVGRGSYASDNAGISGNGKFYIQYNSVGKELEMFGIDGQPFWKMKSREYPWLSYNGKLVLLLNGDQSRVRIADYHGNLVGTREIGGRLCTVISFTRGTDFGAIGFADGTYHVIDEGGNSLLPGSVSPGMVVKNIAVSTHASFAALHYGDAQKDFLRIIDLESREFSTMELKHCHIMRSALHVDDTGDVLFLDRDVVFMADRDGDLAFALKIVPQREGQSSIDQWENFYSLSYVDEKGSPSLMVVRKDGIVFLAKSFINEAYLINSFKNGLIAVKGSEHLFCYTVLPGPE